MCWSMCSSSRFALERRGDLSQTSGTVTFSTNGRNPPFLSEPCLHFISPKWQQTPQDVSWSKKWTHPTHLETDQKQLSSNHRHRTRALCAWNLSTPWREWLQTNSYFTRTASVANTAKKSWALATTLLFMESFTACFTTSSSSGGRAIMTRALGALSTNTGGYSTQGLLQRTCSYSTVNIPIFWVRTSAATCIVIFFVFYFLNVFERWNVLLFDTYWYPRVMVYYILYINEIG